MKRQSVRENDRKSQIARFNAIVLSYLLIASTVSMVFFMNNASAVPQMVELKCGNAYTGMGNVIYGGVNLPVGCLVEIYNNNTGAFTGKTFKIGDGTEGPPGVFKAGQFDYTASFDSTELPITIFLRAYNSNTVASSTTYGDSIVMTVDSSIAWNFPGWSLMATAANVTVISPNGGEFIKGNATRNITWSATDPDGFPATPISIYFSSDSGTSWSPVAMNETNDGVYSWLVPAISSTTCLVRVEARDIFGGIGSDDSDALFVVDSDLPTSTVNPLGGYWFNSDPLTITSTASDSTSGVLHVEFWYRYRIRPAPWNDWTLLHTDSVSPYNVVFIWPNGEAEYEIYSIAVDKAGNRQSIPPSSLHRPFGLDTVPPSSSVNSISPYWVSASPLTLTATANYTVALISKVEFWYRFSSTNATWGAWTKVFEDASIPYTHDFAFPGGNGYYQFYSRAIDIANNYESVPASADAMCAFDNVAPTSSVNVISPYWQTASPLTLTASASDAMSGINYISLWFRYSSDNTTWGSWTLFGNDTTSPWSWAFNFPSGNGYYQFYSRAVDMNYIMEAAPASRDALCAFDNVAPLSSVDMLSPYWRNSAVTVTATTTDATGGVVSVELYSRYSGDNSTWGAWTLFATDTTFPWSWSFSFASGNGYYQFYTRARDGAGNYEAAPGASDAICGYDTTVPSSSTDISGAYWRNTAPMTITATASDAISGLANVELWYRFSSNNATWGSWANFGTDSSTPWSWSFGFPSGPGYYEFYTRARDRATNYEAAPGSADVRYAYDTAAPMITNTSPINGATAVGLMSNVIVTFNKAMNTASVTYSCTPNPGGWSVIWSSGDTVATYSHSTAFIENTLYTFQITGGTDVAGNALTSGAVPNPWSFTTLGIAPSITVTSPANGATSVALTSNVVVTFSEAMNTASVTYSCTPNPGGWSVSWSGSNTIATYSHSTAFTENTLYTFQITAGNDANGVALAAGAVPNPWTFTTLGIAPTITVTSPVGGATSVALTSNVVVTFSEAMNTASVTYTCTPNPGGWSVVWSGGNTIATYSHTAFVESTLYSFQITAGNDANGVALAAGAVPNPWTFTTVGIPPTITVTNPANGAIGVALNANVVVTFSEAMNTASLVYTCTPNPGGWSVIWSGGNTIATFTHSIAFNENTFYTFQITGGTDLAGNALIPGAVPNPWTFTTVGTPPTITVTNPANGAIGVALNANVVVTFSEAMNTASVTYTCTPNPGGWSIVWSSGDTVATYSHSTAFTENTIYTFQITGGTDLSGVSLVAGAVPNPWSFTTIGIPPTITITSPMNGAAAVDLTSDVVVTFSEAMNTASLVYSCTPNPGGWSVVWSGGNTIATFSHSTAYSESTTYTFQVTGATDLGGNNLIAGSVPNPWAFSTGDFTAPTIVNTAPANLATGVTLSHNIIVTFSEAINTGTVTFTVTPNPGGLSIAWSSENTVMTITHNAFVEETLYTVQVIAAQDMAGNNLVAGAVPNPWSFTTGDFTAPFIASTVPAGGSVGIVAGQDIIITFSETMNIGTVTYTITPNPGGLLAIWSAGDTIMTISHNHFAELTTYIVQVTAGEDLTGNGLIAGLVPNPWSFTTGDYTPPTIITTVPAHGAIGVSVTQNVVITFSERINAGTFTYACTPNPAGWTVTWSSFNTIATLTHTAFAYDTLYTFSVTSAQDLAGNTLVAGSVSNPFSFTTTLGATATATGPISAIATNVAGVTITYNYTGAPTSVNLYYTTDDGFTWTLAGNDATVDGSFACTLTVSGTYGWVAQAVGGGSSEPSPPAGGTPPEAAYFILDIIAPTSNANPLPTYSALTFDISFTATDNMGGSGVAFVNLYWKSSSTPTWSNYGAYATSPITFTALGGGSYSFFTIATDNAGNMEPMKSTAEATTLIDTGPPVAPKNLRVYVHENGTSTISWTASTSMDLHHYNIYVSTDPYVFDMTTPFTTTIGTSWLHPDGGNVAINYYYIVRAVDIAGNEETNTNAVGKFVSTLDIGWNMFSIPLIVPDNTLAGVFGSNLTGGLSQSESDRVFQWAGGRWRVAYLYEDGNPANTAWIFVGGSFTILPDVGYWVYISPPPTDFPTAHTPQDISLTGAVPGDRAVSLNIGWNLVGYTSLRTVTLQNGIMDTSGLFASGFTGGTGQTTSDRVFSWAGGGWNVQYLWENGDASDGIWIGTTFTLTPGTGYWIEVKSTHTAFTWVHG